MDPPKILVVTVIAVWGASFLEAEAQERDRRSAVSYVFCGGFNPTTAVSFDVSVRPNSPPQGTTKPRLTATLSGTTTKQFLDGEIDQQLGVKDVKVTSASMPEICFQSLVVDTTIILDKPTQLKASCGSATNPVGQPCKDFGSELTRVFICPQAVTKLLKSKGVISNTPASANSNRNSKPPVYDITNDMAQASYAIAGGVAEGSRVV